MSRRGGLAFGVALLLFGVARAAVAVDVPVGGAPLQIHFSEYALGSYHLDNGNISAPGTISYDPTGNNYVDWLNTFEVDGAWQNVTMQLRFDSALFGHVPVAAPSDVKLQQLLINRYQNRFDVEKAGATYSSRFVDVTLGDAYVTYGRGLVLSLRKVDELGIDTTARGLSATGRVAGLTVNALAGVSNIINVDPATGRVAPDPRDTILGARAEYRFGRWVTPGLDVSQVIYSQNAQTFSPQKSPDQVTSFSATLEAPHLGNYGALYVEYAEQRKLTQDTPSWSSGLYASASGYFGPATVLLEYKDYRNYNAVPTSLDQTQFPELALTDFYTAAPTLERAQQIVLNNTDVSGPHARVTFRITDNVSVYASMAYFTDRTYQSHIYDPYAGAELRWNAGHSRASVSGGYRLNQQDKTPTAASRPFQTGWHAEYDVNQFITGTYSLELEGLHYSHRDEQGPNYLNWMEGQAYLSFKQAGLWAAALGYEYYTEAPQSIRSSYPNVNVSWHVTPNVLVRLFAGGQRAGIKCVNGVCRNFPAFDGGRLEIVTKY